MKYLHKYKSLENDGINYTLEIINDNRLFCPSYDMLNDPFETLSLHVMICGMQGINNAKGERNNVEESCFENYGIVSLTPDGQNQAMWALYANEFKGVCIGIEDSNLLNQVKRVVYSDSNLPALGDNGFNGYYETMTQLAILRKRNVWSFEKEYRLITKNQKYFDLEVGALKYIIMGHNISNENENKIVKACNDHKIKCYKTFVDKHLNTIKTIEIKNYDIYMDEACGGSEIVSDLNLEYNGEYSKIKYLSIREIFENNSYVCQPLLLLEKSYCDWLFKIYNAYILDENSTFSFEMKIYSRQYNDCNVDWPKCINSNSSALAYVFLTLLIIKALLKNSEQNFLQETITSLIESGIVEGEYCLENKELDIFITRILDNENSNITSKRIQSTFDYIFNLSDYHYEKKLERFALDLIDRSTVKVIDLDNTNDIDLSVIG